jgi:hypothetical protein
VRYPIPDGFKHRVAIVALVLSAISIGENVVSEARPSASVTLLRSHRLETPRLHVYKRFRWVSQKFASFERHLMNEHTTNQWNNVGSLLNGLGLKLKLHAEQTAGEDKALVSDAMRSLGDSLENAFEALKNASKDPAIAEDIRNVAQSLSGAVSSTLSGVGDDIRRALPKSD